MMLVRTCLLAVILASVVNAALGAGLRRSDVPAGTEGPAIQVLVWYPCADTPKQIVLGPFSLPAVANCPLNAHELPLIVISHGRAGSFLAHHDTAEALAENGFIVAALNHPGDTAEDLSQTNDLSVWIERPKEVRRVIDFLIHTSAFAATIDSNRIGFFGFSRGGYTGLALLGGDADWVIGTTFCQEHPLYQLCRRVLSNDVPAEPLAHDPRIKAAALADPPAPFFSSRSLASINVPVQLWASEFGGDGVVLQDVSAVHQKLGSQQDYRIVPNAGHFAFFAPCTAELSAQASEICADAAGFDRPAFHKQLDASIVDFFRTTLSRSAK
ncbi:dienelactone hydrolase [Bradyrhizobium iriomotense]|nr:dienelactone hydrolase [Bradyrhizobium iriomotense]